MKIEQSSYVTLDLPTGVSLGARIWRPADSDKNPVPAIIDYHPYRGCDYTAVGDSMRYSHLAASGYACVKLDVRGTGNSTGIHPDQFDENYWTDAVAAVAWLAEQPWCNGRVGMVGVSWPAHASLMVATRQPPALGAIVPITAADDRYLNRYQGGCLLLYTVWWGSILASMQARPPLPFVVGDGWKQQWLERLEAFNNYFEKWISHPAFDDYWHAGSAANDLSRIRCPVLSVAGWSDPGYVINVPRLLTGLDVPCRGVIGAWGHRWPNEAFPGPGVDIIALLTRWFDQWLKGKDTGVMDDPALTAWILDGVPPDANMEDRPGYWISEKVWPSPNIAQECLTLAPGRLGKGSSEPVSLTVKSPFTVGARAGEWMPWYPTGAGPHLPEDQREDDSGSLIFDGEALDDDLVLMGTARVTLDVSVDKPAGQIVVRLCDVDPATGTSARITYGFLNLAHREGDVHPVAVVPGERMRVAIDLFPIGYRLPKGHKLRVAISTCYWPVIWPAREDATLSVHLGQCSLELPVRTAPTGEVAPDLGQPKTGDSLPFTQLEKPNMTRQRFFDVGTNELTTTVDEDAGTTRLEDDRLEVSGRHVRRYRIRLDDPSSASCETEVHWHMRRDDWKISVTVRAQVTSDPDAFHVNTQIEAFESTERVYERKDSRRIARSSV